MLLLALSVVMIQPSFAQDTSSKSGSGWEAFKRDIKNLKSDIKKDLSSERKKKRMKAEKKQVSDGLKDLGKVLKPPPVVTVEEIENHNKRTAEYDRLIRQAKANSKPLKPGIYLIDTKKETAGYSKEYEIVRKKLIRGEFDQLDPFYEKYYKDFEKKYGKGQTAHLVRADKDLLRIYERASMYLYAGDYERAINAFALAEELSYPKGTASQLFASAFKGVTGFAEVISGIEELSPYQDTSWEKILALNFMTVAHLLNGERSAYNVTRRAIDVQNKEREIFKQKIKAIKKNNKKIQKKIEKSELRAFGLVLDEMVEKAYEKPNIKAQDVLSAYVNPLGFYIAGIVQEYDSFEDPSLTSNALISYRKAAELNPSSKLIERTIKDIEKNGVNTSKQTIHILLANGFAPEKKVIETRFLVGEDIVLIKVPIQEERYPKARKVEVYNGKKRLATLEQVADIEAIALRHQADLEALFQSRARIAAWRALGGSKLLGLIGKISKTTDVASAQVKLELEERKTPDMRSWLSLPEEVLGARLRVSKKMNYLTLVSKDHKGKIIATKIVKLNKDGANFLFARSMGKNLTVHNNSEHWIKW